MNNINLKYVRILCSICIVLSVYMFIILSCGKSDSDMDDDYKYNPDKPVVLESFSPSEGGMATRLIISGSNLGNDPSKIKVYFNEKPAAILNNGNDPCWEERDQRIEIRFVC